MFKEFRICLIKFLKRICVHGIFLFMSIMDNIVVIIIMNDNFIVLRLQVLFSN